MHHDLSDFPKQKQTAAVSDYLAKTQHGLHNSSFGLCCNHDYWKVVLTTTVHFTQGFL